MRINLCFLSGKYRQATTEIQKRIENLQHDLAVIGQISGLASTLRGDHQVSISIEDTLRKKLMKVALMSFCKRLSRRHLRHGHDTFKPGSRLS